MDQRPIHASNELDIETFSLEKEIFEKPSLDFLKQNNLSSLHEDVEFLGVLPVPENEISFGSDLNLEKPLDTKSFAFVEETIAPPAPQENTLSGESYSKIREFSTDLDQIFADFDQEVATILSPTPSAPSTLEEITIGEMTPTSTIDPISTNSLEEMTIGDPSVEFDSLNNFDDVPALEELTIAESSPSVEFDSLDNFDDVPALEELTIAESSPTVDFNEFPMNDIDPTLAGLLNNSNDISPVEEMTIIEAPSVKLFDFSQADFDDSPNDFNDTLATEIPASSSEELTIGEPSIEFDPLNDIDDTLVLEELTIAETPSVEFDSLDNFDDVPVLEELTIAESSPSVKLFDFSQADFDDSPNDFNDTLATEIPTSSSEELTIGDTSVDFDDVPTIEELTIAEAPSVEFDSLDNFDDVPILEELSPVSSVDPAISKTHELPMNDIDPSIAELLNRSNKVSPIEDITIPESTPVGFEDLDVTESPSKVTPAAAASGSFSLDMLDQLNASMPVSSSSLTNLAPSEIKNMMREIDNLLELLPDDKIEELSQKDFYHTYIRFLDDLGI